MRGWRALLLLCGMLLLLHWRALSCDMLVHARTGACCPSILAALLLLEFNASLQVAANSDLRVYNPIYLISQHSERSSRRD